MLSHLKDGFKLYTMMIRYTTGVVQDYGTSSQLLFIRLSYYLLCY